MKDDSVAMYLILNEELLDEMTVGKMCVAASHAAQELQRQYGMLDTKHVRFEGTGSSYHKFSDTEYTKYQIYKDWLKNGVRKIVLKANAREWAKLKEEFKNQMVLINDAGYTCVAAGSEVSIGIWPMKKSQRSPLLKRLQAL